MLPEIIINEYIYENEDIYEDIYEEDFIDIVTYVLTKEFIGYPIILGKTEYLIETKLKDILLKFFNKRQWNPPKWIPICSFDGYIAMLSFENKNGFLLDLEQAQKKIDTYGAFLYLYE